MDENIIVIPIPRPSTLIATLCLFLTLVWSLMTLHLVIFLLIMWDGMLIVGFSAQNFKMLKNIFFVNYCNDPKKSASHICAIS